MDRTDFKTKNQGQISSIMLFKFPISYSLYSNSFEIHLLYVLNIISYKHNHNN